MRLYNVNYEQTRMGGNALGDGRPPLYDIRQCFSATQ